MRTRGALWLSFFGACALLVGLFYAEENWRGRRAWENCKRTLRARDLELNWARYVPPPVPAEQNVFGVPEMERWFKGGSPSAWKDITRNLPSPFCPGMSIGTNSQRMTIAELRIGLPGAPAPEGFVALRWTDAAAKAKAASLLINALGPTAKAPQSPLGIGVMLRSPSDLTPAKIYLECQTAPTIKELHEFLPDTVLRANVGLPEPVLKFEPGESGSFSVTMPVLVRAADYLTWSDGLQPEFELIRSALRRPFAQMQGFYENPDTVPAPNFRSGRNLAQTLAARAQCHLLLGQSDKALADLTLINDFRRRTFEENRPMTLLAAMMNVAVTGLFAEQIAESIRPHAWTEPQLAALQAQLNTDVITPVKDAFTMQAVAAFGALERVPSAGLVKRSMLGGLCPRGWGYQRMAARVQLSFDEAASLRPDVMSPGKIEASRAQAQSLDHWSAYTFVVGLSPPDFPRACQVAARQQTAINQALIACALERYRLADGNYPETLDALVPRFLDRIPDDVIGGAPPRYRRGDDGTFILYSIGWSGRDHGGARGASVADTAADWVWPG